MKLITNNADTITRKKQPRRACESCRKRKRRCIHTLSPDIVHDDAQRSNNQVNNNANLSTGYSNVTLTRRSPEQHGYGTSNAVSTTPIDPDIGSRSSRRFIGDLNPESVFRSATSPEIATRGQPHQDSIGTWLVDSLKSSETQEADNHVINQNGILFNSSSTTQRLLSNLLEEECLNVLPPTSYLSQLLSFYAEEIHPLLPIVDIKSFQTGIDRNCKILLSQAMCLLSSTNYQCQTLLYLSGENGLLAPRNFGRRIFCAMRCAIELGAVTNRMVLIQALGSLSLFTEGPEGPEIASQICAKMIQLVQTLGLHIQRGYEHEDDYDVTSLCCAWALDRLNAATHGRPVIIHEQDIGRDLKQCFEAQTPAFRLLLSVIFQMDQVIDLYRPQTKLKHAEADFNLPAFEELIVAAQCANLDARILNTIEVLYYAVAILSCRSTEKSSNIHVRQTFAASRINSIVRQDGRSRLILLSFIPYAVSLSLSIYYKQMRYTKVEIYRLRAREELESTCALLDQLGSQFYLASAIARMGNATIAEMDRVAHANPDGSVHTGVNLQPPTASVQLDNPDIDIFDMFDPNFGLDDIDAVFQSNLDLSMPMYLPFPTE